MTTEDLMRRITAYYGPYPRQFTGKTTMAYVEDEFTDAERDELWRRLIREFSTEYKVVPDVAVLARLGRETRREIQPALPPPAETESDEQREANLAKLRQVTAYMVEHSHGRT